MYSTSASDYGRPALPARSVGRAFGNTGRAFISTGNAIADRGNTMGALADRGNAMGASMPDAMRPPSPPRARQPARQPQPQRQQRHDPRSDHEGKSAGPPPPPPSPPPAASNDLFEFISAVGGASTVAFHLRGEGRLALMVAANSGRPGGSVGVPGGIDASKVHCGHRTQEESLVANFLHSAAPNDAQMQETIFNSAVGGAWGLPDFQHRGGGIGGIGGGGGRGGPTDRYMTIQRYDYVNTTDPRAFAHPAHVVENAWMSPLSPDGLRFRDDKRFEADLVFVAGPNASDKGGPNGSMQRTANRLAQSRTRDGHAFFREGQRHALRAGLDAMIKRGVDVALVARLSCGIYAGPWRDTADADFETVLGEVLREDLRGKRRRDHFRRVVVPMLKSPPRSSSFQHSSPSGSRSAPSCECTQCQRPRCSRPDGRGYFSHCGDSCRHGRCMHGKGGKGGKVRGYGR